MKASAHASAYAKGADGWAPCSPILREDAGIRYLSVADVPPPAIVRLLAESFAREPMVVALGVTARDLALLIECFLPECRDNGLSVVAVPQGEPGVVAGAFLCRDFKSPLPAGLVEACPWFLPVGQALATIGEHYEAKRPVQSAGEAVDLWMVGTDPRFARRGIARRLFQICAERARERGFGRCVTECTGGFSQRAAERAGFSEVTRLAYRDFRFAGRSVFADVPAPHTHLAFYERML